MERQTDQYDPGWWRALAFRLDVNVVAVWIACQTGAQMMTLPTPQNIRWHLP